MKAEAKAKAKAQKKANKQPKTVKVTSVVKALVICITMLITAGVFYNLGQYTQKLETSEIDKKAIIRVQDIKDLMQVVK